MLRTLSVYFPMLFVSVIMLGCSCQPYPLLPTMEWTYTPDESSVWGLTIGNTTDNGFIIGGGYDSQYNMYGLKLTAAGAMEWQKSYSNPSPAAGHEELWRHEARGLLQTADGGYIMLGAGNNHDDGLPTAGYLLVKTDASGTVVWSKTYAPDNPYDPGHFCVNNRPYALDITSDGGYMAVGSSYVGGFNLASILKTDAQGNVEFIKVINDNNNAYVENIVAGQQTADGGYILCGYSDNGSPRGYLALLIKLDNTGSLEFSKTYQYPQENHGAEAYAVTQTQDGGYLLGGELINDITKASTYGCWISKVDSEGNAVWFRNFGHDTTIHYPNAIKETPDGDFLAAGAIAAGNMALAKFDANGTLIWNYALPDDLPSASANALTLTEDGGCVLVGSGISGGTIIAKVNDVFSVEEDIVAKWTKDIIRNII